MNRKVLLIEPNYKNKYPPMGLMKIATYYRRCKDDVRFFKGDLKLFGAQLLCEEYLTNTKEYDCGKDYSNLLKYIQTGKCALLDSISNAQDMKCVFELKRYHYRYQECDFPKFDIVCVTSLFTFYWKKTIDTINYAKNFCKEGGRVFVGGIAASILPKDIAKETGIKPHVGLLNQRGILDEGNLDIIDELPLDYSILEEVDYVYPARDAYFGYMTRGCPNHCAFCVVKTLEPKYKHYIGIKHQIEHIDNQFGAKKDLLLMDNNVFASISFNKIIDEIKACGFAKGATYVPPNEYEYAIKNLKSGYNDRAYIRKMMKLYVKIATKLSEDERGIFYQERQVRGLLCAMTATVEKIIAFDEIARPLYNKHFKKLKRVRYIDFNQGLDARLVTEEKMAKLAEVNIRPMRIAFDHYNQKDIYIDAIRLAAKYGIKNLSNYLLYNFEDKPEELYYRMKINVDLCEELGVSIYSFPMKYHPISDPEFFKNRDYIGKHWNRKFIRAVQSVLNSTKGKIGKGKAFFEEAFGKDLDGFMDILWMPETFIIHRFRFKDTLTKKWREKFNELNATQLETAKEMIAKNDFSQSAVDSCSDNAIREVLKFYQIKRCSDSSGYEDE